MNTFSILKSFVLFVLAFAVITVSAVLAVADDDLEVPDVSEEASQNGEIFVTVTDVGYGGYQITGYADKQEGNNETVYRFVGDRAEITITYIPKWNDYLVGAYVGDYFCYSTDRRNVTFSVESDCVVKLRNDGLPDLMGEVSFLNVGSGAYLEVDGTRFSGIYKMNRECRVTAVLPKGFYADSATLEFIDGSEAVTLQFVDNSCVFPPIYSDFMLTVEVVGVPLFSVSISQSGEGTVTADDDWYEAGETATFSVVPADGYEFGHALLNGELAAAVDGTITAVVEGDIELYVEFTPKPTSHTITLLVDPKASGGDVAFAEYTGSSVELPIGDKCEIIFTPHYGYVLDRVYINGMSTVPSDNRITVTADKETTVTAAFKKASYTITAAVPQAFGGTVEAVGYTMSNGMISVDHGGSVTFRIKPALGYLIYSIRVDDIALDELVTEFTFENVTSNHTLTVGFVAEGVNEKHYIVTVDCGAHGTAEPGKVFDVAEGGDLVISFVPDVGYAIDSVYFDGQPTELVQDKLVLIDIRADHIVQVTFKQKSDEAKEWITCADIDWNADDVIIDLTACRLVGREVFEKIATYTSGKHFTFSNGLFDIVVQAGTLTVPDGEYADLSYDTMIKAEDTDAFLRELSENGINSLYTVLEISDVFPVGSALTIRLGKSFSAKTVNTFSFSGGKLELVKEGTVVDQYGVVTLPVFEGRTVIIAIDDTAPENHIVTVNCGTNGTADPINSKPVPDGGSLTVRIFPFDGYMVETVMIDGVLLELDDEARLNGPCELPISNIRKNMTVEITFALMPVEEESTLGLIFIIIIISVAIVGGGVLFFIQWKRAKY